LNLRQKPQDQPERTGRAFLVLALIGDEKSQIFLDQTLADTNSEDVAQWATILLGGCGGPVSALGSLKYRLIQCREALGVFKPSPQDAAMLVTLGTNDGFFYDLMVALFGQKLMAKYPDLVGYWMRQRATGTSDDFFLSHLPKTTDDPFVSDLIKIVGQDASFEDLAFPERQLYNNVGNEQPVRASLAGKIAASGLSVERKMGLLGIIAMEGNSPLTRGKAFEAMALVESDESKLLDSMAVLLDISDPFSWDPVIDILVGMDTEKAFKLLLPLWSNAYDSDMLGKIHSRLKKAKSSQYRNLILYSVGDSDFIQKQFDTKIDDTPDEAIALLQLVLEAKMGTIPAKLVGRRLIIQPWDPKIVARKQPYLSQEEFNKVALALRIEFNDESGGSILCQVGSENTGEVFRLMFENNRGLAFWAYWVMESDMRGGFPQGSTVAR